MVAKNKWILGPNNRPVTDRTFKQHAQLARSSGRPTNKQRHIDDLPVNRLHPRILLEVGSFSHTMIIAHRQAVSHEHIFCCT
jgi:hypothetical protein